MQDTEVTRRHFNEFQVQRIQIDLSHRVHEPSNDCFEPHPWRILDTSYPLGMFYLAPSTLSHQFTERIGQGSQPQRYASFLLLGLLVVSEHNSCAAARLLHLSTSSMTIPFSTYFISINRFSWVKTRATPPVSTGGIGYGSVDTGGINLLKFARDGNTFYLGPHPT